MQRSKFASITSSARATSVGGTSNRLRHDQVNDEVELSRRLDRKRIGGFRPSKILSDQVAGALLKSMKATVPPGVENSYFS